MIQADEQDLINEYLELFEKHGHILRSEYVQKSKYNYKYQSLFGSFAELKRQALGFQDFDTDKPPVRKPKDMPEALNCSVLRLDNKPERFKILILSDIHVPFHDKEVLVKVFALIEDIKPDVFVLNGDFLDLFSISSYSANSLEDLRDITLGMEYAEGNKVLNRFDKALPKKCEKFYLYGNHENRYYNLKRKLDNAKYGDALISPKQALSLTARHYTTLTNSEQDYILVGNNLEIMHGKYANKYFSVKHLEHINRNVIVGHIHTLQIFTNASGREAYSLGFLANEKSNVFNYAHRLSKQRWKKGFICVDYERDTNNFWVTPVRVTGKRFVYNGKLY